MTRETMFRTIVVPLAANLARKWAQASVPFEDLQQEALLHGWLALERFDSSRGYKVATFVTRRMAGAIQDYLRLRSGIVRGSRAKKVFPKCESLPTRSRDGEFTHEVLVEAPAPSQAEWIAREDFLVIARRVAFDWREEYLVVEYYAGSRTLKCIAGDLQLSESRCSQMLTAIRARARRHGLVQFLT